MERGDIVSVNGRPERWVLAELIGSARGTPMDCRVIRWNGEQTASLVTSLNNLSLIEVPAFEEGDKVRVGSRTGVILNLLGAWARVRLDASRKLLKGGDHMHIEEAETDVSRWQLTLENRL